MIFDKGVKAIQWVMSFSTNGTRAIGQAYIGKKPRKPQPQVDSNGSQTNT